MCIEELSKYDAFFARAILGPFLALFAVGMFGRLTTVEGGVSALRDIVVFHLLDHLSIRVHVTHRARAGSGQAETSRLPWIFCVSARRLNVFTAQERRVRSIVIGIKVSVDY